MYPVGDGVRVCDAIRRTGDVPLIVVSAQSESATVIAALDAGADDYVTLPCNPHELRARAVAVLHRAARASPRSRPVLALGDGTLDLAARQVRLGGREVALRPREFALLVALARQAGAAVSRTWLLTEVWGFAGDANSRTVDMHVRTLRGRLAHAPLHIETVRGVGYRLVV